MARITLPRPSRFMAAALLLLLVAGCASWSTKIPVAPEVTQTAMAARVQMPADLNINPPETVVKPGTAEATPTNPPVNQASGSVSPTFALPDAIAFALQNNPRLRSARAAIERARGQEQVAFSPFLPQIDLLNQDGIVSSSLAPGIPGPVGFLIPGNFGTRSYAQTEVALQWTVYDFGRTGGHYHQAMAQSRIAELQFVRANQAVEFDVTAAYLEVLLARASRRIQEDAVRRSQAILDDAEARRKGGVALKEDVLRTAVQLSESRDALVLAREGEFESVARLNNAMGRNASLPLEVIDVAVQPPVLCALAQILESAANQRPEVGVAQQAAAAAQDGRVAARAEFLPRIYVRGTAGHTDGENVIGGWQEGVGLHVEAPLYHGGNQRGELKSADADVEAAIADAQTILDGISLQVNLAYRAAMAARERIDLARTAVVQADENLRLLRVRYRNGNATPTDIVDSEAAVTRSQQRFFSAGYNYLEALARLDYAVGQHQGGFLATAAAGKEEQKSATEK